MRRIAIAVIVLSLCAVLSACGSSSSSPSPPAPKVAAPKVAAPIVAAALAQKSVHWEEIDRPHMQLPIKFVTDVNADSGTQRLTFAPGTRYAGKAQVRLVNDIAYVEGDAVGLKSVLYLDKARAKKYAGRWISIPKGDTLYAGIANGLTLASIIHDVIPGGRPLRLVRKNAHGTPRLVVEVDTHSRTFSGFPGSLSANANGKQLPVAFDIPNCVGCYTSGTFSKWNEPVHVQAPAKSVPITTVRGR
jgi:hypothetical protein